MIYEEVGLTKRGNRWGKFNNEEISFKKKVDWQIKSIDGEHWLWKHMDIIKDGQH